MKGRYVLSTQKNTLASLTTPEAASILKKVTHIYTDLDGTLFAPGGRLLAAHDGTPSVATAQALVALKQAGVEVILVTGRNRDQGSEILRLLNLNTFIGELGCVIQEGLGATAHVEYALGDWKDFVFTEGLAPGELPAGVTPAKLIEQSGVIERLAKSFPGKLEPHNPYKATREVTLMLRGCVDREELERILNECSLPLSLLDNGVIHPQKHTLTDCPEIHIYHLMPRGTSKGSAVLADVARRGLLREQTLAIGDAIGDMEVGEHTGSFVLVNGGAIETVVEGYYAARGDDAEKLGTLFVTEGKTADGWAEFANALLAAKGVL
jgi:hydroxymethylpyrimidine pyrophosphatase-like HAD family hydrolase